MPVAVVLVVAFVGVFLAVTAIGFLVVRRLQRTRTLLAHAQREAQRTLDEATAKPDAPAIQVQGASRSERCPYCHTDVVEAEVTCADCLARHHRECWDEHQECASCGAVERYTGVERTAGRERREPTQEK